MNLSRSQKIMKFFSSEKRFNDIRKESLEWGFECPKCNEFTSVWEIGGVRYQAKNTPTMRIDCPKCKERIVVNVEKFKD